MIEAVRARYGVRVEMVSPDATEIETMVAAHGPNLFYESVALRHRLLPFPQGTAPESQARGVRRVADRVAAERSRTLAAHWQQFRPRTAG